MISRRNFLKYSGLAVAAAGSGFTAGKLSGAQEEKYYVVQGFLPLDDKIIAAVFNAVNKNIRSGSAPVIAAPGFNEADIRRMIEPEMLKGGRGHTIIRMTRLERKVLSDILVSDKDNYLYDPSKDHTVALSNLRENIRNKPADIFFSIEYREDGFLSSLFRSDNKFAVVQNHKGIIDRIELKKDYDKVIINGSAGNTNIRIQNGMVCVTDSCCKNKICVHSGNIMQPGSIIACAPNKVLVRIENV